MSSEATAEEVDARLLAVLPERTLYAVGGRVRDELRSANDEIARPVKDLDYVAVGLSLAELTARLQRAGPANVVGASFAVVKVDIGGKGVDVALPRRERSTGPGHRDFDVEAGPDVALDDDLARRDFRMNMVARALPGGELVDPWGGEADIRARRIDILRDAAFEEDPLRMLRAAQFAARMEFELTARTFGAMQAAAPRVATVSAERVRDEIGKLLSARRPSLGIELLRTSGVLAYVWPELLEGVGVAQNEFHAHDVYGHALATTDATAPGDETARLAALFHDVGKPRTKEGPHFYRHEYVGEVMTYDALRRLRFAGETVERVGRLVRNHMYAVGAELSDAAVRRFIRRVGQDDVPRQFALRHADIAGSGLPTRSNEENEQFEARVRVQLAAEPPLGVHSLAIDGRDVIELAIKAGRLSAGSRGGPIVGRVLNGLLEYVLEHPEANTREALLEVAWNLLK